MDGVVSGCTHPRAASLLTGQNKSHHLTPTLEAIIEQPRPRLPEQPPCACAPSKEAVANGPEVLHFNITAASSQHHQCIRSTSPQHHQIRFSIYKCKPSVRPKSAHQKGCICIWKQMLDCPAMPANRPSAENDGRTEGKAGGGDGGLPLASIRRIVTPETGKARCFQHRAFQQTHPSTTPVGLLLPRGKR